MAAAPNRYMNTNVVSLRVLGAVGSSALPSANHTKPEGSSCPRFPARKLFDWVSDGRRSLEMHATLIKVESVLSQACHLRRPNGIFKFDKPFNDVRSISINQAYAPMHRCSTAHCTPKVELSVSDES